MSIERVVSKISKKDHLDLNNIDDRWTMIGNLILKHGTEEEKLAWALCRADAADGSCCIYK